MKNMPRLSPLILSVLICACTNKDNAATSSVPEVAAIRIDLAFGCTHEADHLPPLDPNADALFQYARYLQNLDGPKDFNDIARYYRIAAAYGHYKANHNAQRLISQGLADSPDAPRESVDLAKQLVEQGIPGGYFDIGHYLETGYGLKQDPELALRYFRKAADLGNPEAQAYVAEQLVPHDKAPEIARQMRECAMNQGYGDAATSLGINQKNSAHYPEAIAAFQKATMAGDTLAAYSLEKAFSGVPPSDRLTYLGLAADAERARRYKLIGKFIDSHDGKNPKVPDIDKIVPLPPAKLPAWDGTFQWDREQAARVAPLAPPDEQIEQLAKAKHLDPATGLPLAHDAKQSAATEAPPAGESRTPLGTIAKTGDACPEDGVWCAVLQPGQHADANRRFLKGDTLPSLTVNAPRQIAMLDKWMGARQHTATAAWQPIAYLDQA